jgi:hypothetical protein
VVLATDGFVHVASAAVTAGPSTQLDHPRVNGVAGAVALVTPSARAGPDAPILVTSNVGLAFTGERWSIVALDGRPIPVGAAFKVWVAPERRGV